MEELQLAAGQATGQLHTLPIDLSHANPSPRDGEAEQGDWKVAADGFNTSLPIMYCMMTQACMLLKLPASKVLSDSAPLTINGFFPLHMSGAEQIPLQGWLVLHIVCH